MAPALKHLLDTALLVMELLYELNALHPDLNDFSAVLIRVMKYAVYLLPNNTRDEEEPLTSNGYVSAIDACLRRALLTLTNLKEKKANFFGVYRQTYYVDEIKNLERKLHELINGVHDSTSDHLETEHLISDLSSKLFWTKYFGADQYDIPWSIFEAAFLSEYGIQPPDSMLKLKHTLVGEDTPSSLVPCDKLFNIYDFDAFCSTHAGLYASFQHLVDPGKVVYIMGSISDNEDSPVQDTPTILEALLGIHIVQLSCGGQHIAALTDTGCVFTWGRGRFGRLGHNDTEPRAQPELVRGLAAHKCTQVACGYAYTAAVTTAGVLFTWGAGENGRLGTGSSDDQHAPRKVVALSDRRIVVEQVFAGSVHTCVLSQGGSIYSFGKSEYTGHGRGDNTMVLQ